MANTTKRAAAETSSMVTCTLVLPRRYLTILKSIAAVRGAHGGLANGRRPSISSVMREILDPVIPALEAELARSRIGGVPGAEDADSACGCASGN
jgi:hypothetical protein